MKPKINKSKNDLKKWEQEKKRLLADIDNLQKRKQEEMIEQYKFRHQDLIVELLDVIDVFKVALKFEKVNEETKKFLTGVEMAANKFDKILTSFGLKKIVSKIGDTYDPSLHQTIDSKWNKNYPENTILKINQDGYSLHNRILRPTRVVVNQILQKIKEKGKNQKNK